MNALSGLYLVVLAGVAVVAYDLATSYTDCQASLQDQLELGALMRSGGEVEFTPACVEMKVKAEAVEAVAGP